MRQGMLNLHNDDDFVGHRVSLQTAEFLEKLVAAMDLCREHGKGSTSFIQRHMGFGYNEASFIIEQLERLGLVSPPNHEGRRQLNTFVFSETKFEDEDEDGNDEEIEELHAEGEEYEDL